MIDDDGLVLFQGDSITAAGRTHARADDLGQGYVALIAAWFAARHPARRVRFLNRGISGNRARDLLARWPADCLNLRPAWVSILIGVNDTWRRYDRRDPTSAEQFAAYYRAIIELTRANLGARIVLCEPFLLHTSADRRRWRADLDPKIAVVRALAEEFDLLLVPLDRIFAAAAQQRAPAYWAPDGVHPSPAGHALIAQAWLDTVGVA